MRKLNFQAKNSKIWLIIKPPPNEWLMSVSFFGKILGNLRIFFGELWKFGKIWEKIFFGGIWEIFFAGGEFRVNFLVNFVNFLDFLEWKFGVAWCGIFRQRCGCEFFGKL